MSVRVRFAPSPTGELHIGGARTALFNWLYARHMRGAFLLRIEDTDTERSESRYTERIFESLRWLGLDWDGEAIYQSQRRSLYDAGIAKLLDEGRAYKCFCSKERLDALREGAKTAARAFVYDKACAALSKTDVAARVTRDEPFAVRFRVSEDGVTAFRDGVYGDVEFENRLIGDFIIARSDGTPTYNFTNVMDDIELRISHVIRGDDHLSNTPKQILMYQALGPSAPQFAHLPLILGPDRTRLSKRHGATSVLELREQGFFPESVFNCLALLGWSYDGVQEIFSKEEMIEKFSLERVSKAAAIFDSAKLEWMNGCYVRSLPRDRVEREVKAKLQRSSYDVDARGEEWLSGVIGLEIERARTLREFAEHLAYFFSDAISYDAQGAEKFFRKAGTAQLLATVVERIQQMPHMDRALLERELRALADELGVKFASIVHPVRLALTGRTASPGLFDVMFYLGKERVIERLARAVEACRDCESHGDQQA